MRVRALKNMNKMASITGLPPLERINMKQLLIPEIVRSV